MWAVELDRWNTYQKVDSQLKLLWWDECCLSEIYLAWKWLEKHSMCNGRSAGRYLITALRKSLKQV